MESPFISSFLMFLFIDPDKNNANLAQPGPINSYKTDVARRVPTTHLSPLNTTHSVKPL